MTRAELAVLVARKAQQKWSAEIAEDNMRVAERLDGEVDGVMVGLHLLAVKAGPAGELLSLRLDEASYEEALRFLRDIAVRSSEKFAEKAMDPESKGGAS